MCVNSKLCRCIKEIVALILKVICNLREYTEENPFLISPLFDLSEVATLHRRRGNAVVNTILKYCGKVKTS